MWHIVNKIKSNIQKLLNILLILQKNSFIINKNTGKQKQNQIGGLLMEPLLKMENISKSFPGVKALSNVQLDLHNGEVLALVGENGAGKSTLMKILTGIHQKDEGTITLQGNEINVTSPKQAQELGISIIHQELNLMKDLSIAENIFIGREPKGALNF